MTAVAPGPTGAQRACRPELVPLDEGLVDDAAHFLHAHLDRQIAIEDWRRMLRYPWASETRGYGYALLHRGGVVGVLGTYYSERQVHGHAETFCNLHSWCVHPDHRAESLRLLLAPLRHRDHTLTTLTVSRDTVEIMKRFGFSPLDETIVLLVNPLLAFGARRTTVTTERSAVLAVVDEDHRRVLLDLGPMRSARASLARDGDDWCLCLSSRERRRGIAVTRIVYVSHPAVFTAWLGAFARSFISEDATTVTTCPPRFLTRRPPLAVTVADPRPQLFRSSRLHAADITCLYSELTR